jgi:7-dehydrocholesterol reductase
VIRSLPCAYVTKDGQKRESALLLSGWWGWARHMNYTGDLLLTLAFSMACGFEYLFPYFYLVYLTILLVHRCFRDEQRCREKYGEQWTEYCRLVPYRFIPYIW